MTDDLLVRFLDVALKERVLCLSTYSELIKEPWTAPVYYIFLDGLFFFFSSPSSRHISDSLKLNNGVNNCFQVNSSVSIYRDGETADKLQGIQMTGWVEKVKDKVATLKIASIYSRKYNLDFGKKASVCLLKEKFRSELYVFTPKDIFFMDNSVSIGFRKKINLECKP